MAHRLDYQPGGTGQRPRVASALLFLACSFCAAAGVSAVSTFAMDQWNAYLARSGTLAVSLILSAVAAAGETGLFAATTLLRRAVPRRWLIPGTVGCGLLSGLLATAPYVADVWLSGSRNLPSGDLMTRGWGMATCAAFAVSAPVVSSVLLFRRTGVDGGRRDQREL